MTTFDDFQRTWAAIGASSDPRAAYDKLIALYAEPHRDYHNLRHIEFCLREFQKARHLCRMPETVAAAIWFHDAIYDTHAPDNNEERSAAFAESLLNLPSERATAIRDLILDTKHSATPKTDDGCVITDVDLASLGIDQNTFMALGQAIRREYGWVETAAYNSKRLSILESFLARPHIYHTQLFQDLYEAQARRNLRHAISELRR